MEESLAYQETLKYCVKQLFEDLPDIITAVLKEVARVHSGMDNLLVKLVVKREVGIYLEKLKQKCPNYFDCLYD
jgi:hypothetical protein